MINLLALEPKKATSDLTKYSSFIYGTPKIGKSTFVHKLYGNRVFFIATEDRHETLVGAMVQRIHSWSDYLIVIQQLKNPQLRERFDVICIDTVGNLHEYFKSFVAAKYNEARIGERKDIWGADYTELKEGWPKGLDMISEAGYIPCFVGHATQTTIKVPLTNYVPEEHDGIGQVVTVKEKVEGSNTKVDVQYFEYEKYVTDMQDKVFAPINKMVDNILFLHDGIDGNGVPMRMIELRETLQWQAGSTFEDIDATIPLDAEAYKDAVTRAIQKIDPDFVVDHKEKVEKEVLDFDAIMNEAKELGLKLHNAGKGANLTFIVDKTFGTGNRLTDATPAQAELLMAAVLQLREEVSKL